MTARGAVSGAWDVIKLVALAGIVIAGVFLLARSALSGLGAEQPTQEAAEARVHAAVFPTNNWCLGTLPGIDGPAPPCVTPMYVFAFPVQGGPTWCIDVIYLHQRQSDVDAAAATRPYDMVDEVVWDVPYFRADLPQDVCGEFYTASFNGRNNPDDPGAWTFVGDVAAIQDDVRRQTEGS